MPTQPPGPGEFNFEASRKGQRSLFMAGIGFVDRHLDRPAAALLVKAVLPHARHPEPATWVSAVMGLGRRRALRAGEDGLVRRWPASRRSSHRLSTAPTACWRARAEQCSGFGSHPDLFLDRIVDFSVFAGIAVGASRHFEAPHLLILGLLRRASTSCRSSVFYPDEEPPESPERGDTGEARAMLYWAVLIFAATSRPDIFIYLLLTETLVLNTFRLGYFVSLGLPGA